MSNMEIILGECLLNQVNEEVDTFQGWKTRGYQVQKGEKAKFQTKIWKPVKAKNKQGQEEKKLIMVTGSFFGASQVKRVEK